MDGGGGRGGRHPGRGGGGGGRRGGGRRGGGGDAAQQGQANGSAGDAQHAQPNPDGARQPRERTLGFRRLEQLSEQDGVVIMQQLSEESMLAAFGKLTSERQLGPPWIRVLVKILAKVCCLEYRPIVLQVCQKVCQKAFLDQLLLYIVQMGFDDNERMRDSQANFYRDFCTMTHRILKLSPSLACDKMENLIKKAASELADLTPFQGYEEVRKELDVIKQKLLLEKERLEKSRVAASRRPENNNRRQQRVYLPEGPPPNNFREVSVFPTADDIVLTGLPYVRPCIPKGPYEDAEHYLDVQFRLLREDFVRALRDGVNEYCDKAQEAEDAPPTRKKRPVRVTNLRVYEDVELVQVTTDGIQICFDVERRFADKTNWDFPKKFKFGSLLLLTRDRTFSSVVFATVCKRSLEELREGRVIIEQCDPTVREDLSTGRFLMLEAKTAFGDYRNVLQALKDFDEESFPLREYVVLASNVRALPAYQERALDDGNVAFRLMTPSDEVAYEVRVDDARSWPTAYTLGLDESQFGALSGAITNKVMLIQGPPGTGKTFMGLKVAATLLQNRALWNSAAQPRPLLIVCLKDHALDQFMGGLLPATRNMVRDGGWCDDERLKPVCIRELRKVFSQMNRQGQLYRTVREVKNKFFKVKHISDSFRHCFFQLKQNAGIISPQTLYSYKIITKEELATLTVNNSILSWLGLDRYIRFPDQGDINPLEEVILDPSTCDFTSFPQNMEAFDGVKEKVVFVASYKKLQEKMTELEEEGGPNHLPALERLWATIRRDIGLLQAPADVDNPVPRRPLAHLSAAERWQFYTIWKNRLLGILEQVLDVIDVRYAEAHSLLREWNMVEDQNIMASHLVLGMTTSNAAQKQRILKQLKPRIVIVEEAAEVFESHVFVALAGEVEHLIMIGDHQQLRPNPSVRELASKYHLDVSLFERLINNGVHHVTLSTQHRMRPEIASLICPAIYPDLRNDQSVYKFPDVIGVTKNVFFIDHTQPEVQAGDAQTFHNVHEANFTSCLVRYLLLQGYVNSKVTVLCSYKGQQFYFQNLRKDEPHLKNIRITTVDEYQGEECDVIVLSLVRSNDKNAIGYLKIENRVGVALSRARHGLFIVGNMSTMTADAPVWRKVKEELVKQGSFGCKLSLRCTIHGTITPVGCAEDFDLCPQGGCLEYCGLLLPCGHYCPQVCHTQDREHKEYNCLEPCRERCPEGHLCPDRCSQECQPCKVPKTEVLACKHSVRMQCHQDPRTHKCKELVTCILPACQHTKQRVMCFRTALLDLLACDVPCIVRMDCGHVCGGSCHVLEDPQHKEFKCMRPCGQKKTDCSQDHICKKMCYEECEECNVIVEKRLPCGHKSSMKCREHPTTKACTQKCEKTLTCGHKCNKLCHEACSPCPTKVKKLIPQCGHTQEMMCSQDPRLFKECRAACLRFLECRHPCKMECREVCEQQRCEVPVLYRGGAGCGHQIMVPCSKRYSYDVGSPLAGSGRKADSPLDTFTRTLSFFMQRISTGNSPPPAGGDAVVSSAESAARRRELLLLCQKPCGQTLECSHKCGGTCGTCRQGRLHVACQSKCERMLTCGHVCKEPCATSCPPCQQKCPVKCRHSVCGRRCGEPCAVCKEPCTNRCRHVTCPAPCGDLCLTEPCSAACTNKVAGCGHVCVGLCGDTCLCRECNQEKIDEFMGFGSEDEENARFVVLPDCGHIFESRGLDEWMREDLTPKKEGDSEIIKKVCPQCKTPVATSQRYSNVIKRNALDVAKVKSLLYGNWTTVEPVAREARTLWEALFPFPAGFKEASRLTANVTQVLQRVERDIPRNTGKKSARKTPPLSLTEIKNLAQFLRILHSLGKIVEAALSNSKLQASQKMVEIQDFVEDLCRNLSERSVVRLSPQEAADITMELERLQRLAQLCEVEQGNGFPYFLPTERDLHRSVSAVIRGITPYLTTTDRLVKEQLAVLAQRASVSITQQEIKAVVAAMGMAQGHWYKCPNGHPYCITECGGAMQEGTCNECGAGIGGGNHRLRSDNTLATEIDGATRPAWPNNLR